jgi:hypothetical protein
MNPHVRRGNDRDACADGELGAAANLFRQGGHEPWCEDVHRRLGSPTVARSRSRAFTKKGAMIVGPPRIPGMAFSSHSAVTASQKSVTRPTSSVPR